MTAQPPAAYPTDPAVSQVVQLARRQSSGVRLGRNTSVTGVGQTARVEVMGFECNRRRNQRPRPGRRKEMYLVRRVSRHPTSFGLVYSHWLVLVLSVIVSCVHGTQVAERNGILIDPAYLNTPATPTPTPTPLLQRLFARAKTSSTSTTAIPTPGQYTLIASTGVAAATSDPSQSTPTSLPQPFDSSLGTNFTSSTCPSFFRTFLNDKDFKQCYPFSLLLQTSTAFFAAQKSFFRTTQALDASCSVSFAKCASVMSAFAGKLRAADACGPDYTAQNPLVLQAYTGLSSYNVMYQAACEKDSKGDYCFANAITNASSIADSYPYFLPLGVPLPTGQRPSCSPCLKKTMMDFAAAAGNSSMAISKTYMPAAEQINIGCGTEWVQSVVNITSGVGGRYNPPSMRLSLLAAVLGSATLLI